MVCGTGLSISIPQFPLSVFFFAHTPSQVKHTHLLDFLETYGLYERYDRKTFPPIGSLALGGFSRVLADGSFLEFLNFEIQDLSPLAYRQQAFKEDPDPRSSRSIFHTLCVDRELPIRRPGQKLLSFWVWLVVRVRSKDRATPPTNEDRDNL